MTNTTYFHSVVREEASTTTASSSSPSSSSSSYQQEVQPSSSSSTKLYKVIGRALISLVSRRRGLNSKNSNNKEEDGVIFPPGFLPAGPRGENENLESSNLVSLSFIELKTATRNFSPDFVLGEGGFGKVFKAWIDTNTLSAAKPGSGIAVAIKILNNEGYQGHEEWLAEVNYLGRLNHPNLVRLRGYCFDNEQRLLLYEFMHRGSLENQLFRRSSSQLSWSLRMKIALGAAKGLAFLHRADINVIHRGFKSSNILLDLDYNAKLSDFGFARDGPTDEMTHVSTRVMGTVGYAAPEYIATGHLSAKSDVYTFGVVLLELITGRRSFEHNRPPRECNLVEWTKPYLRNKGKISRFLDNQLKGQCSLGSVHKAANLAFKCLVYNPKLRPDMDEVAATIEQLPGS